jgi:hypothetical protein
MQRARRMKNAPVALRLNVMWSSRLACRGGEGDTYVCEDCFNKIEEDDEDEEDDEEEEVSRVVSRVLITAEDEEWEDIYNSTERMPGEPRGYDGEEGTYYKTSPNGSGPSVAEGYWVRTGGNAVWKIVGNDFQFICGAILEVGFMKCRLRLLIK